MNLNVLLAGQNEMLNMMLTFGALIAIMYFFMFRPQQKKQKELKEARNAMKKGDRVITAGGVHGKIKDVKEQTLLIEIAEGVKIEIEKSSVHPLGSAPEETPKVENK